jgi:hypothetical protein
LKWKKREEKKGKWGFWMRELESPSKWDKGAIYSPQNE